MTAIPLKLLLAPTLFLALSGCDRGQQHDHASTEGGEHVHGDGGHDHDDNVRHSDDAPQTEVSYGESAQNASGEEDFEVQEAETAVETNAAGAPEHTHAEGESEHRH